MSTELHRPRVSAFLALSLDGFIAGEGGDLAWLEPYNGDAQEETGYSALMASVDTLLMGRNSYDTVLGFPEWFYGDKPVVVLTHRPAAPREHVSFRQGALAQVLDELILFWVPVTLERGVPLFAGSLPGALRPVSSTVLPSGLVRVVYQSA
ncbi:deaminase [Aeromonas dhakensis]|uniref:dihydrofolate reductase family protein n=1 Tax=Aeromonas dhakensis TaxID=196024 RepID=UPI000C0BDF72|nr:dihydrofolate reductase family protein [Aeromonas dhakensis]PHS83289.1 deaminase [Aeromonas dhakensis]PHS84529.1 deaminase [Aeromonas dhakensis]